MPSGRKGRRKGGGALHCIPTPSVAPRKLVWGGHKNILTVRNSGWHDTLLTDTLLDGGG